MGGMGGRANWESQGGYQLTPDMLMNQQTPGVTDRMVMDPVRDQGKRNYGEKKIYDVDEIQRLVSALRRIGIFELANPPETFRPNPFGTRYALPNIPYTIGENPDFSF